GGGAYRCEWFSRMLGQGSYCDLLAKRFELATKRAGLSTEMQAPLRTDLFRPAIDQLSLFGSP
ncbi:MAG: radical SAM protein, partial [Pseudomonadales bacterium]|nr:radical SAM protein [Pseudomonadales bacterium]